MTAAELIAAINELPAEEQTAFTTLFLNEQSGLVKSTRSKAFAAGKTEGSKTGSEAATKLTEAQEKVSELEGQLAELQAKTPDVKAIEEKLNASWLKKLDAEKQRADSATTALRDTTVSLSLNEFLAELSKPADDGTRVNPAYLKVAKAEWADRIRPKDEGGVRVLQLDGDMEYEAPDVAAAVKLLAADARKKVPSDFIITNADNGGGVMSGGRGGSGGGVAVEKQRIEEARASVTGAF